MRVRVVIEIDKPLRRCLRVDMLGDGVESIMLLKYERLPNFCFRCGLLGHTTRECPNGPAVVKGEELLFGLWMRASVPAKHVGFWGRRRDSSERGDRESWRPAERNVVEGGDGRRRELKVGVVDRNRSSLNLASNKKGKGIAIMQVNDMSADSVELNEDSVLSKNQGIINMDDFVFKSMGERKELISGPRLENTLTGKWKRRARLHLAGKESTLVGVSLGRKKALNRNKDKAEGFKKQRCVSSSEDSAEAVVGDDSAGRVSPACRAHECVSLERAGFGE
ncbi:hypothetical protein Ddye_024211 [Dipteronia dyeriana]|uniref:CCHC-type domain-containing protein n=1 Tax=Dipteronia dyeriana TaxID=168575 RepID=A0AAD9TV32_9ROSI|nr:hypothetical protein Ddye_024211 [Dipteronia dyeriana]